MVLVTIHLLEEDRITKSENLLAESSAHAVIGGGYGNQIKGNSNRSVIGGGGGAASLGLAANIITNGLHGTIIGGSGNAITGARGATVLGGEDNLADGNYSVVAGRYANAGAHPGVFVFADSTTVGFTANVPYSAHFGVTNGLRVVGPSITLDTSAVVPTVEGHVLTSDADGVGTWQAIPPPPPPPTSAADSAELLDINHPDAFDSGGGSYSFGSLFIGSSAKTYWIDTTGMTSCNLYLELMPSSGDATSRTHIIRVDNTGATVTLFTEGSNSETIYDASFAPQGGSITITAQSSLNIAAIRNANFNGWYITP